VKLWQAARSTTAPHIQYFLADFTVFQADTADVLSSESTYLCSWSLVVIGVEKPAETFRLASAS
jgi:hypothetical protein